MDMQSLIYPKSSSSSSNSSTVSANATVNSTSSGHDNFQAPIASSALSVSPFTAMRSPPTIFQRSTASSAISQAPTLAPLRFIIPSSRSNGNSFSNNGNGVTASVSSTTQPMFSIDQPEREPQPEHSMLYPQECYTLKTVRQQPSPPLGDQKQAKKLTSKSGRALKLSSRSTKSKARPGLRKGKWTEEESRYAAQLTTYFKEGLLPLERGTMLRLYLSQKLNCEPMRITKKFTGGECIGKQVFRPCSPTPETRVRIMQAQLELVTLEAAFIKRLKENREDPPVVTDEYDVHHTSSEYRSRPVPLKPRTYQFGGDDKEGDVEDANAVGLLLDFFYKANRNEKKNIKKDASIEGDETLAKDNTKEKDDQVKKEPSETSSPTSSATSSENDTSITSPTKRMRALSVSGCVDPATAKRSRVGSFSAVTAA